MHKERNSNTDLNYNSEVNKKILYEFVEDLQRETLYQFFEYFADNDSDDYRTPYHEGCYNDDGHVEHIVESAWEQSKLRSLMVLNVKCRELDFFENTEVGDIGELWGRK